MREETDRWLAPMIDGADAAGLSSDEMNQLIMQASMPAAEAADETGWFKTLAGYIPPAATFRAIDWIRFGQLLRERLGWDQYPEYPGATEGGDR
jgi:hypothetical protein